MKKTISIIGGGPSALLLGCFLDSNLYDITIYEKNKALGRKFLVAGDGGFNLTHSDDLDTFKTRYTPQQFLAGALDNFSNKDLIKWLNTIGIKTFVGSSKRVYPEQNIKPIQVLRAIETELKKNKVNIEFNKEWMGWKDEALLFLDGSMIKSDYTVFCLGGGSWSVTGSNSQWLKYFDNKEVKTAPFQASNCRYLVNWDREFIEENQGTPLKNIASNCLNKTVKGEIVFTKDGLEGNAVYALSPQIRQVISTDRPLIYLDLKPMLSPETLLKKLRSSKEKNISSVLKKELKFTKTHVNLLKTLLSKRDFLNVETLSQIIKRLPIYLTGTAPLDNAISTVGGIELDEVNVFFELKKLKNNFCIGEMLNWDAPTGGYLLQACFSSGVWLAKHLNNKAWLDLQLTSKTYNRFRKR